MLRNQIFRLISKGFYLSPSTEKLMASPSSTVAWKIPWSEEPGRLQSMGREESGTTERLHFHFSLSCIGEGNGNPLQCSCLDNPRDGGAWWAAVYGVAQSRTRLTWFSYHCLGHILPLLDLALSPPVSTTTAAIQCGTPDHLPSTCLPPLTPDLLSET